VDRCGGVNQQAGSEYPGTAGKMCANNFINYVFYVHIRILLVKANSMIYIFYIKYVGKVVVYMLAVGDNELDVGDDKATSLEAAEVGTHMRRCEEIMWIGVVE